MRVVPEILETRVFVPSPFLSAHQDTGIKLAKLVQACTETIGVHAANDILKVRRQRPNLATKWDVPVYQVDPSPSNFSDMPLFPPSVAPSTEHFYLHNCSRGSLASFVKQLNDVSLRHAGDEIQLVADPEAEEFPSAADDDA